MIPRRKLPELRSLLDQVPAVVLVGPRQVGKTTLALEVAEGRPSVYLDLESDADRARLNVARWLHLGCRGQAKPDPQAHTGFPLGM